MATLLSRTLFRESVFERDCYKCIVCSDPAVDAHHIIERRLFSDGGYYIDNGASLCTTHHIEAEQTVISTKQIYEILNITKRVLPEDFYKEYEYTKWGDIILTNGTRLPGPLFYDESVQKILTSGKVLNLYSDKVKYPRTFHLPWSDSKTNDDRTLKNCDHFKNREVVVTLKLDGENTTIYHNGYMHARSVDGESHPSQSWVRNLASRLIFEIPEGYRICGENLYAKHSIEYNDLESYFYLFSIWKQHKCLSWDNTVEWAALLDLEHVPIIYDGVFNEQYIRDAFKPHTDSHEGYVIRIKDEFYYPEFKNCVAKFVRSGHIATSHHWRSSAIIKNQLKT